MSNSIRRLLEQQEAMRRLTDPMRELGGRLKGVTDPLGQVGPSPEIMRLFEAGEEHRKLFSSLYEGGAVGKVMREIDEKRRLLEGSVTHARQLGLLDPQSDLRGSLATITEEHERYKRLFELPAVTDVGRLAREALGAASLADTVLTATGRVGAVEQAMRSMRSPWLNAEHELRSARAFADLVGIGRGVAELAPYEALLVKELRPSLGDWRDPITSFDAWQDPILRSGFYHERGFDSALTDFTREGFAETIEAAGLAEPPASEADADEDGLARSRQAFSRLQELERAMRRFVVRVMTAAYGDNWMERQLPAGMLDA